ncbi:DUF4267 domain-containing protein [Nocardia sp. NPDC048505]|uniref:DUF4267 domain-containing protein n=1 Tax=unclassified Nocardia TaxID=2637762 RepID=UPI0033D8F23C
MNVSRLATVFSATWALFILYVGINYLIAPETIAPGMGMPAWPDGEATAFLNLKGVRDATFGVVGLVLLATKQRYALGIATLAVALAPLGDMLTVFRWDGSTTTALFVHGLTAVFVALTGALLIREHRTARAPIAA